MQDWNVVVSVREPGYRQARELLAAYGRVQRTDFYNVLALRVEDIPHFLETLRDRYVEDGQILDILGRVVPVLATFIFQTPQEFELKAQQAVTPWLPRLGGRSLHVRMHRRGFRGRLSSQEEERFLDEFLLENLAAAGMPGRIDFADPDTIIAVETIAQWAGLSLWDREQRLRYPFLGLD